MRAARGARADLVQGVLNIVKDDADARREGSSGCSGCDRRAKWDLRHQSGRPRAAGSGGSGCSGRAPLRALDERASSDATGAFSVIPQLS